MTHFALDDQIASQPEAVRDILQRVQVPQLDPERPLVFTGIGTSLHACRVAAAWVAELSEGRLRRLHSRPMSSRSAGVVRRQDHLIVVSLSTDIEN